MKDIEIVKDDKDGATFAEGRTITDEDVIYAVNKHMMWYDKLFYKKVAKATIVIQMLLYSKAYKEGDWKIKFE